MGEKASTPTCCRECGKPMASYVQPIPDFMIERGRTPNTYVTCEENGCAMQGYTLAERTYAALDLTPYLKRKVQK